jgi:hypothetical protein
MALEPIYLISPPSRLQVSPSNQGIDCAGHSGDIRRCATPCHPKDVWSFATRIQHHQRDDCCECSGRRDEVLGICAIITHHEHR